MITAVSTNWMEAWAEEAGLSEWQVTEDHRTETLILTALEDELTEAAMKDFKKRVQCKVEFVLKPMPQLNQEPQMQQELPTETTEMLKRAAITQLPNESVLQTAAPTSPGPSFTEAIQPGTQTEPEPTIDDKPVAANLPKPRLPAIMANEKKYLEANDLDSRYRLASAFYRSGMVPKSYKDAASVFAGMELALELGLKPFTALKNIAVINGNPSLWGDLPLSLCRRSGLLEKITEILLDKEYNEINWRNKNLNAEIFAAVCITRRKGADTDLETVFTMDMAKNAGLLGKDNVWKTYPRRMIQMRARSQNLKDNFGDVLLGIEIAEYDHNFLPMKDVTPEGTITRTGEVQRDNAAEINKTLSTEKH